MSVLVHISQYISPEVELSKLRLLPRHVSVERLDSGEKFEEEVDVVVAARGQLNEMKWPDIPGLDKFEGEKMHSATWNEK